MKRRQCWRKKLTEKQINQICHLGLLREAAQDETRGRGPLSIESIAEAGGVTYSKANNAIYFPEIYGNNDFYRDFKPLIDKRLAVREDLEKIRLCDIGAKFDINEVSARKLIARQLPIYKEEVTQSEKRQINA